MTTQTETPVAAATANASDIARDLEQLSELATLVTSARDAMSDEIVTRLSSAFNEGITLLDRLTRNEGLMRLLQVLDHPESQHLLIGLAEALRVTSRDMAITTPAKGGLVELWRAAFHPATQEGIRLLSMLGQHLSDSLREQHRRGG